MNNKPYSGLTTAALLSHYNNCCILMKEHEKSIDIDAEYNLIQQKRSKLSANMRRCVVRAYEYNHKEKILAKRYLIQSGTYKQAEHYAKNNALYPNEWSYLNRPEQARGLRGSGIEVVKTGTYWQNEFTAEIDDVVHSQELDYA